ncbi:hypothetical protein ACHQM5_013799 [Ranunculus cassubicifolius]
MDSLLQSYASSDDEEEQQHHEKQEPISKSVKGLGEIAQTIRSPSSLPPPKSSSSALSSLLPPPKTTSSVLSSLPPPNSSGFSSLPPPNSYSPFSSLPSPSTSEPKTKRVVQFRPPPMVKPPIDDDDEEEEKQRKPIKETPSNPTSSLSSFFSSLPAPRNTLGSGSAPSLGAGRRSIIETNITPTSNYVEIVPENEIVSINESQEPVTSASDPSSYAYYEDNNQNYGNYDIVEPAAAPVMAPPPEAPGFFGSVGRKRGRNEIPAEVIEVKQDELMKNRPREDQVKSTGIAFGPSYQPAGTAASGKGKPSKLHKRKHQIGALYFDMRAKESELAERRSKGYLTKAETQAKYGW